MFREGEVYGGSWLGLILMASLVVFGLAAWKLIDLILSVWG